jgi:hypothetical protein
MGCLINLSYFKLINAWTILFVGLWITIDLVDLIESSGDFFSFTDIRQSKHFAVK